MNHTQSIATALPLNARRAASEAVTRENEQLAALAGIGGLFLLAALALVSLFEQFRPIVFLVFLLMLGIAPPLSACLVHFNGRIGIIRPAILEIILAGVRAILLCFLIILIVQLLLKSTMWPQSVPPWLSIIVFVASVATIVVLFLRRSSSWAEFSGRLDACLIVGLSVAVFVLSPFNPAAPVPIGFIDYSLSAPHFGVWALVGVAWVAAGVWLRRHEGWAFPRLRKLLEFLAVLAVGLLIIGLYDDSHFVDMGHYLPLVGPALHALHGGIAMVDVYSVYGLLPWLIHSAAFALFEPTFGTAAVVVRLTNLSYFAVIALILFFVSRRRVSALWFFIPALLVAITSHNPGPSGMWNMNALPMTLGGRWLLPSSMTLLLVAAPRRNWSQWAALALIMVASLSSVEILAFTLAPWGYCSLLDALRLRAPGALLRRLTLALAAIAIAQLGLVAFVYLWAGRLVDYWPYFSLFLQFRPSEDSIWSVAFVPYYALWLPIGFAYFVVMAAASYRALRGEPVDSLIDRLLPVAVLGLGPLAYFFGRPQEGTLSIACLTFAVIAIGIAEAVFINAWRFGPVGPALSGVMALAFAFTIADGLEHFMRPADPSRGNSTVLRRCFDAGGCRLADVPRNIGFALHTQPLDPRTKVGFHVNDASRARIEEVISMLRRWSTGMRYVGMLTEYDPVFFADPNATIGLTALMATGQWFAWGESAPLIDGQSSMITDRILERVDKTSNGLLVILSNRPNERLPLTSEILGVLTHRCQLALLENGKYNSAFMTERCGG